jgi:hypothetical protein
LTFRLFLNRVVLKAKKDELFYKFIDRRIFRLSEGHEEARKKEAQKVSKTLYKFFIVVLTIADIWSYY